MRASPGHPRPRSGVPQAAAPAPSSGPRTFLLVALSITTAITGLFALLEALWVAGGTNSTSAVTFAVAFAVLFAAAVIALLGVAMRAPWSRMAAILAGVAISITCIGLVLGVPILIGAARAHELSRPRTVES